MSQLINIFLDPGKVFAEQKEKPTFWVPMLLTIALMAVMTLMYFGKVDSDWFADHQLAASGSEMSANEIAQAKAMMPSAKVMGYIGAPVGALFVGLMMLLMALYFFVAGKVTGTAVSFRHGLSLTAWSGMPTLLGFIVVIVGIVMMTPQTSLESLSLTNIDPLFVQLPMDHPWRGFATKFSLLSFWSLFLSALGWRIWGKTSWTQAITVAAIPNILIFGTMALWAVMKS